MMMSLVLMALQLGTVAPTTTVAATQDATAASALVCQVIGAPRTSKLVDVIVGCGHRGVLLGPAESFTSAHNAATGSTLVVTKSAQRMHVYLVSPSAGEAYHVDDISRDLAKASGRYPDAGLPADLAVGPSGFAISGRVQVPTAPSPPTFLARGASDLVETASVTTIDLTGYATRAKAKRIAVSPPPANATND